MERYDDGSPGGFLDFGMITNFHFVRYCSVIKLPVYCVNIVICAFVYLSISFFLMHVVIVGLLIICSIYVLA